jgi:hypothetical protein
MGQFADRHDVTAWLNARKGQRVCVTSPGTTLRIVGRTDGIEELDACSTDVFHGELHSDLPGLQISLTLHDDALALLLLAVGKGGRAGNLSLPLSVPYERLRLDIAEASALGTDDRPQDPAAREEPDFSPYELLHFPRPD